jgi:hypothetical protein
MRESLIVTEFILLVVVNFLIGARIGSRGLATVTRPEDMPGNIGIVFLGTIATYLLLYLQERHGFVAEPEHIAATFVCAVIGFLVGRAMRSQEM